MKKAKWVRLLPVLALLAALLCLPVQAAGAPRAVLNAKDGVVRIFCEVDGDVYSGSGFLVANTSSGAMVVTNYHVVQGASEMELYYDGNGPVDLEMVAVAEGQDLCLLRTQDALPGMAPLTLADKVEIGEAVYALGYPGGSDVFSSDLALTKDKMALTSGLVSALTSTDLLGDQSQAVQLIQTNADINHGNSGGPLLNEQGQVIGVNTLALNDFGITGVNAAIHVDELRGFLQAQGVSVGHSIGGLLIWGIVLLSVLLAALLVLVLFLIRNEKKAAARRAAQQMGAAGYPGPAGPVQAQAPPMAPAQQVANNGQSPAQTGAAQAAASGQPQGQTAQWAATGTPAAPEVPAPVPPQATTAQQVPPAPPAAAPQGVNGMPPQGGQTDFGPAGIPAAVAPVSAPALSAPLPPQVTPVQQGTPAPPLVPPVAQVAPPPVPPAPTATPQTGPVSVQNWAPTAPPPPVRPAGNPAQPAAPRPKKKIRIWPIVTAIALCLVLALGITAAVGINAYYRIFNEVDTAVEAEDYAAVVALYDQNPWLGRVRDEAEQPYSNGMMLMRQGKYEEGAAMLAPLGDYKDAAKAIAYATADKAKDPIEKYKEFDKLGDFLDSKARTEKAEEDCYYIARDYLSHGDFSGAQSYLKEIPAGYRNRDEYLELIKELGEINSIESCQEFAEKCSDTYGFNIPNEVRNEHLAEFLEGEWTSGDGREYFNLKDNFVETNLAVFYNYPIFEIGARGMYDNGTIFARVDILGYYEIQVYYYGEFHQLYREWYYPVS